LQCFQNLFVTCTEVVHDIYMIDSQINIRIISDMNNFLYIYFKCTTGYNIPYDVAPTPK
jgi:hypothetical protein